MIERKEKRYVTCPVCGRHLLKCQGVCSMDITCVKCNRDLVAIIDEERVIVLENRRGSGKSERARQVKLSVQKNRDSRKMEPMKRAVNC